MSFSKFHANKAGFSCRRSSSVYTADYISVPILRWRLHRRPRSQSRPTRGKRNDAGGAAGRPTPLVASSGRVTPGTAERAPSPWPPNRPSGCCDPGPAHDSHRPDYTYNSVRSVASWRVAVPTDGPPLTPAPDRGSAGLRSPDFVPASRTTLSPERSRYCPAAAVERVEHAYSFLWLTLVAVPASWRRRTRPLWRRTFPRRERGAAVQSDRTAAGATRK